MSPRWRGLRRHRQPTRVVTSQRGSRLEQTAAATGRTPVADQQDQERRDDQRSGRVAEPTGEQMRRNRPLRYPPSERLPTPMVALTMLLKSAASAANLKDILGVVERASRWRIDRRGTRRATPRRVAAAIASEVAASTA